MIFWIDELSLIASILPALGYISDYLKKPREFKDGLKTIGWVLLLLVSAYFAIRFCFLLFLKGQ